jgi:hypothetical protein
MIEKRLSVFVSEAPRKEDDVAEQPAKLSKAA